MSIGKRPTMGEVPHAVEVFVLDYDGDLVARPLVVDFVSWIREEKRFADRGELARAIADDVRVVRERLARPAAVRPAG